MSKKSIKYKQGETITNLNDVIGEEFIYFYHKIYHRGWFGSWQLRWIEEQIKRGTIRKAIRVEEKKK